MKKRKMLIWIIIIVIVYVMSFASRMKREEGFIGVYPSFATKLSSNDSHGVLYIVLGMSMGPLSIPVYAVDRISSAIYDTVLLPYDYYKYYRNTNGKQVKFYEDENRVEWVARRKIVPLLTDKKEKEYTLKNGDYIGDYFEYYLDGKLKIIKKYTDKSILINSCEYYGDNNIKEEVFYFEDGQIMNKKVYFEDKRINYSENYNEETKNLDKTEYFYTKEDRLEKIVITEKNYLTEKYYGENEKLKRQLKQTIALEKWEGIEETYYENGKIKGQYIMEEDGVTDREYSEKGDIIKEEKCKYNF